jgi:hypothetical protein
LQNAIWKALRAEREVVHGIIRIWLILLQPGGRAIFVSKFVVLASPSRLMVLARWGGTPRPKAEAELDSHLRLIRLVHLRYAVRLAR